MFFVPCRTEQVMEDGDDTTKGTAPLTRADIPELVKAVAEALAKKDTPDNPELSAGAGSSKSSGKSHLSLRAQVSCGWLPIITGWRAPIIS